MSESNRNSFTELELAFFRAGDEMSAETSGRWEAPPAEQPTSLWTKLFRRKDTE